MDIVCPRCHQSQAHPAHRILPVSADPAAVLAGMGGMQLDMRCDPTLPWAAHLCSHCGHGAPLPDLYTRPMQPPAFQIHEGGYWFDPAPYQRALELLQGGATVQEVVGKVPKARALLLYLLILIAGQEWGNLKGAAYDALHERVIGALVKALEDLDERMPPDKPSNPHLPEALLPRREDEDSQMPRPPR